MKKGKRNANIKCNVLSASLYNEDNRSTRLIIQIIIIMFNDILHNLFNNFNKAVVAMLKSKVSVSFSLLVSKIEVTA